MTKIKFGTDGWRAIIAQDFTIEHVKRIAEATAIWMQSKALHKIVIGYDSRFGGKMFAETVARVMAAYKIRVNMAKGFTTSPMVSLGVLKTKSDLGIIITAGHQAATFNGYKIKLADGSPITQVDSSAIEALIPRQSNLALPDMKTVFAEGLLNYFDFEQVYIDHVKTNINLNAIRSANIKVAYDAMFGAGMKIVKRLLHDVVLLHCEENPAFPGRIPDPTPTNLGELSMLVANTPEIDCGLATDSDAGRLGMYDSDGNFVDANHLLLLLLTYLKEHKKLAGKVVCDSPTTNKIRKLTKAYKLNYEVAKTGFRHIIAATTLEKLLIGGEESGGIAVSGHIPDRDGIWAGLLILEYMALTGKSLKALISETHNKVGTFYCKRKDIKISAARRQCILEHYKNNTPATICNYNVTKTETIDGYKFIFNENEWVMFRFSGTESVLRIYTQTRNLEQAKQILEMATQTISKIGYTPQEA